MAGGPPLSQRGHSREAAAHFLVQLALDAVRGSHLRRRTSAHHRVVHRRLGAHGAVDSAWLALDGHGRVPRPPAHVHAGDRPAFRAPGLDRIDSEARRRYESDGFRYPPYTYAREYCLGWLDHDGVIDERSLRVACAAEREVLMG